MLTAARLAHLSGTETKGSIPVCSHPNSFICEEVRALGLGASNMRHFLFWGANSKFGLCFGSSLGVAWKWTPRSRLRAVLSRNMLQVTHYCKVTSFFFSFFTLNCNALLLRNETRNCSAIFFSEVTRKGTLSFVIHFQFLFFLVLNKYNLYIPCISKRCAQTFLVVCSPCANLWIRTGYHTLKVSALPLVTFP